MRLTYKSRFVCVSAADQGELKHFAGTSGKLFAVCGTKLAGIGGIKHRKF